MKKILLELLKLQIAISVVTTTSAFFCSIPFQKHFSSHRNSILSLNAEKQTNDDQDRGREKKQANRLVEGIRLNKVFKATHSRRAADALIESGRVSVNGKQVLEKGGFRVIPYQDVVKLDGIVVSDWEDMNAVIFANDTNNTKGCVASSRKINRKAIKRPEEKISHFEYVKYWKPLGVTCTTDPTVKDNIIDSITQSGYRPKHRVYPVGRLDKETTGLILLTSDGRLPNAVLRGEQKQPKVYEVVLDRYITDEDIIKLRRGVIITTVAQRDGKRAKPLTCRTRPCEVERLGPSNFEITLTEGRNRQIRKMVGALNYTVVNLKRVEFMGMMLRYDRKSSSNLKGPGDWTYLNGEEMSLVQNALKRINF